MDTSNNAKALADSVLAWWQEAQFLTSGDAGERNVFNIEPAFVQKARDLLNTGLVADE